MTKKYYTPKIEEFHVGFEYEQGMEFKNKISWSKQKWLITSWGDKDGLQHVINTKRVRVKHLDREDIGNEGWKGDSQFLSFKNAICFHNGERLLIFRPKTGGVCITARIVGLEEVGKEAPLNNLFNGTINNKSELRKILIQTGVKIRKVIDLKTAQERGEAGLPLNPLVK